MFQRECICMGYRCSMLMLIAWCAGALLYLHSGISRGLKIKLKSSIFEEHGNTVDAVINTVGCTIPSITLYDAVSRKLLKRSATIKSCVKIIHLVERNATHMWIVEKNGQHYSVKHSAYPKPKVKCFYKSFYRPDEINITVAWVDDRIKFKPGIQFSIIKPSDEFILVECEISNKTVYRNLFLFAQKKSFIPRDAVGATGQLNETNSVYNVLVIGVDSVSRLNLHRTMPKTVTYLKQLDAVELLGYNKIGDNTFPNAVSLLLGSTKDEIKHVCYPHGRAFFDNCPFIWEWYKQKGFFTAYGEDGKQGIFNYHKRGFINTPTDYYLHPFMHEINKAKYLHSPKVCLNGHQLTLRYVMDLTAILNTDRLFGFFWESTISHNYLQDAKLLDPDYFNLFKTLNDSKYLDQTIVFFISDHGIRFGEYAKSPRGRMEARLPFVFILTPQSFRSKYKEAYKNLMINSQRLTTPMDLHETLMELISLKSITDSKILNRTKESNNENKRSMSLFLPIPETRTCRSADIKDTWCSCHHGKPVPITLKKVQSGAELMVKYLNNLLLSYDKCAHLQIDKIMDAFEITSVYNSSDTMLRIVMEVKPGGGIFEGTVRHEFNRFWSIGGPLNRLNAYGNQGFCINQDYLKLYCFCEEEES